ARRSFLLSVRQKRAAWDWVCRSSNGPCSITTVALTLIPARAALLLASPYPRPRMATRPRWRALRGRRPIFGARQRASLHYLSDFGILFSRLSPLSLLE